MKTIISKFYIGQEVICINNKNLITKEDDGSFPPLNIGKRYIINGIEHCPKCSAVSVDVGIRDTYEHGIQCGCGDIHGTAGVWWCSQDRFEEFKY